MAGLEVHLIPGTIKGNPGFPFVDITDSDASIIELLLSNRDIVDEGHKVAEEVIPAFRYGHEGVDVAGGRMFDDQREAEAFSYGFALIEAANLRFNGLVAHRLGQSAFRAEVDGVVKEISDEALREYAEIAITDFWAHTPNTARVVETASSRFYSHLAEKAILGAAFGRRILHEAVTGDF